MVEWRCAAVVDTALALSRPGLLFSVRLAQSMDVFLVRHLWRQLDSPETPALELLSELSGEQQVALREWRRARVENSLSELKFNWMGDSKHESLLPQGADRELLSRFERLLEALDPIDPELDQNELWVDAQELAARETLALAGALVGRQVVIFSLLNNGAVEPYLCQVLQQLVSGSRCVALEQEDRLRRQLDVSRHNIDGQLQRCGAGEALWSVDAVAIHLVVPHALILPSSQVADNSTLDPALPDGSWDSAVAYWYRLAA